MISVILPTYNESGNIELLVSALERAITSVPTKHEIIVVDDNSPDGTAKVVERLSKRFPTLKLVKRPKKAGLTSAIVTGASVAKGSSLVVMDADLSHSPELVPILASSLDKHDLAIGSRLIKGGGVENWYFHRKLISKGAEFLARTMLGMHVSDPLTGFFAIRKNVFEKTRFRTKGYKLLLNILSDHPDLKVKEVPYLFRDRYAGNTKLGISEIVNYVFDIMRIKFG